MERTRENIKDLGDEVFKKYAELKNRHFESQKQIEILKTKNEDIYKRISELEDIVEAIRPK